MKTSLCIALWVICFSAVVFGQQTPAPTPPADDNDVVRISTTLIQIDVTVTDKQGNLIKDLKPEELEIYENQSKQKITNFSFIQPPDKGSPAAQNSIVKNSTPKESNLSAPPLLLPPAKIRPENIRRTIAFVIDDLSLESEGVSYTQKALRNFVGNQMQEGDLIAIIRTSAGIGTLQQFTSDKRQLYAAIKNIRWSFIGKQVLGTYSPLPPNPNLPRSSGEEELKNAQAEYDDYQKSVFTVGTLGATNYVVNGMKRLPGRKAIMFISNRLSLKDTEHHPNEKVAKALSSLIESANRASIVIYSMTAQGMPSIENSFTAESDTAASVELIDGSDSTGLQDLIKDRDTRALDTVEQQEGLRRLSLETGGLAIINRKDLGLNIRNMLADQQGYYLIGYEPDAETFNPEKLRFNRLFVKVNRPDVIVRYRSGFFGVAGNREEIEKISPSQQLNEALTSPFAQNSVNVHLAALFGNDAKGSFVRSYLYIQTKDLIFSDEPDGWKKATFDIAALASGEDGTPIVQVGKSLTFRVSAENYRKMIDKGIVYNFNLPVKKPGAYQLHIAIRDDASEKIGSASQFIDVPNLEKKRLALSGITLGNFTPEEWQQIQSTAAANNPLKAKTDTALRSFKPGSILSFSYTIYNAKIDKTTEKPNLIIQVRMFRDGKVIFEGNPKPVDLDGQKDLARISVNSATSLGAQMQPGDYILQVIAKDPAIKGENQSTTQWIDFEVTN